MEDLKKKNSFLGSNFHLDVWSFNARLDVWKGDLAAYEGKWI